MEKEIICLNKLSENTEKFLGIKGDAFKNRAFDFLFQVIFATLYNIEKNRAESIKKFKDEVLSKRDNPMEYYKALIIFANL